MKALTPHVISGGDEALTNYDRQGLWSEWHSEVVWFAAG